jgi:hypothetical protein
VVGSLGVGGVGCFASDRWILMSVNRPSKRSLEAMARTVENPLNRIPAISQSNFVEEPNDFSLLLGGPIYQFFRKSHLPLEIT